MLSGPGMHPLLPQPPPPSHFEGVITLIALAVLVALVAAAFLYESQQDRRAGRQ